MQITINAEPRESLIDLDWELGLMIESLKVLFPDFYFDGEVED